MTIVVFILLGGLLWLISLLLLAFAAWGFHKLARLLWEKIRRALLRPGTAQIISYAVFCLKKKLHDPSLVTTIRINAPDFRSPMVDSSTPQLSSLPLHSKQTFKIGRA